MTNSNWTNLGYVIGFTWATIFAVRYLVIWPDYSQAISFVSAGLFLMALSWLYQQNRERKKEISGLGDQVKEDENRLIERGVFDE